MNKAKPRSVCGPSFFLLPSVFFSSFILPNMLLRGLLELIYPPRCLLCDAEAAPFCDRCSAAISHDPHPCCPRCAARVGPFAVTGGSCALCRAENVPFE